MIERLGFGTYGLSGAYGSYLEEKKAIELIKKAYSLGVRYFDTSPSYGDSELILGKALKGLRTKVKIASKVGVSDKGFDLSKEAIQTSVNNSLKKLQTDYLDYLFIHYHDSTSSIKEVTSLLKDYKKSGVIKEVGLGHLPPNVIDEYLKYLNNPYLMTEYNIINRLNYKKIVNNKNIVAFSITARGVFENPNKKRPPLYIKSVHNHIKEVSKFLDPLVKKYKLSKTQLAILFALNSKNIKYALTGPTKINHLIENINAAKKSLISEDMKSINSFLDKQEAILKEEVFNDIKEILETNYSDIAKARIDLTYLIENSAEFDLIRYNQAISSFFKVKKLSESNRDEIKKIQKYLKAIIKL